MRASRVFGMGSVRRQLKNNPAYLRHVDTVAKTDAAFFLSHRHFLAKGLTPTQRAQTALHHYNHEMSAFDVGYFDKVYQDGGLKLWRCDAEGNEYDIRLMPGSDVLYEGGVSLVLHVNGNRVCVVSYSAVPQCVFLPALASASAQPHASCSQTTLFVTRKQLAATHDYQKAFNIAFDRTTPAHLCFGALTAVASVLHLDSVIGISATVHPSCTPDIAHHFEVAYTQFWQDLSGRPDSPYGYVIDMPMKLSSLDAMDAKARKRSTVRRAHIEDVRQQAMAVLTPHARHLP